MRLNLFGFECDKDDDDDGTGVTVGVISSPSASYEGLNCLILDTDAFGIEFSSCQAWSLTHSLIVGVVVNATVCLTVQYVVLDLADS